MIIKMNFNMIKYLNNESLVCKVNFHVDGVVFI